MHSLTPTLRLGRNVWDRRRMPAEEFHDRVAALRRLMRAAGIGTLVAYDNGLGGGHGTYLSNHVSNLTRGFVVVVPLDGPACLIFQGAARGEEAARATTWIEDVRACPALGDACVQFLRDRRSPDETIGVAGWALAGHEDWETFAASTRAGRRVDADPLLWSLRMRKTEREAAQIQHAASIARTVERGLARRDPALAMETDVASSAIRDARLRGAEDVRVLIGRPNERGWSLRPAEALAVGAGEPLIVALDVAWERYWARTIRTYAVEAPGLALLDDRETIARFEQIAGELRVGAPIGACAAAATALMGPDGRGIVEEYGLGHGIGVGLVEPPALSGDPEPAIEPGMCLVIRTVLPHSGGGFVMRADPVWMAATGPVVLG